MALNGLSLRWRAAALVPAGALAVLGLRYLLTYGGAAGQALSAHGHGYLKPVVPCAIALLAASFAGFLTRFARAWRCGQAPTEATPSLLRLWAGSTAALLVIHVGQSTLEGLVVGGNPGAAALLDVGGLCVLAAALAVGGLIALALRGAHAIIARAAVRRRAMRLRPGRHLESLPPRASRRPRVAPLARSGAERAPPVAA